MLITRHPLRSGLTLLVATFTVGVATSSQSASGATATAAATTFPSEYGALHYDDSAHCSTGDVEVAYVANRLIVQTDSPGLVRSRIDALIGAAPAAPSMARSRFAAVGNDTSDRTRVVDHIEFPTPEDGRGPITPVFAFDLPGDRLYDVVGLARTLTKAEGWAAAPDYAAMLQGGRSFFQPDGLPQPTELDPVPRPPLTPNGRELGTGVRVGVYDSGLAPTDPTHAGLLANVSTILPNDVEIPDRHVTGQADHPFVGHGLMASSTVATLAPGAIVDNARVARSGISTDFTSAKRIAATLRTTPVGQWPNVLVASFMSMACDADSGLPGDELVPVSLRAASEAVGRLSAQRPGEMMIVAAAGNHGTQRRAYPAAFDGVIAVGALDATLDGDGDSLSSTSRTAPIAEFSARGSWVDFYAPGVDLVTAHVDGIEIRGFEDGVATKVSIDGTALVQGTSVATPYTAAVIAELMSTNGVSVSDAVDLLRLSGTPPQAPCGGSAPSGAGVAIALVAVDAAGDDPALEPAQVVC